MFDKILIANRGEIACRIIATAQRRGIATVAVYSDADASCRHVALADEAVHIGPAIAAESYLCASRIIAAAQTCGVKAIHPGYGFLSENAAFAAAVDAAGLTFIGPPARAMAIMGRKDQARACAAAAGVPIVPGYHGDDVTADRLAAEAHAIGYPVLIKARAGGGGKGMRRVNKADDFAAELEAAQREAESAFGDPACIVECEIIAPRHVEMQIFADHHGTIIHTFERDCSLQRRYQKIIEEAPAPGITEAVREAMAASAIALARAVDYRGAGTVEFILDGNGPPRPDGFWFLEMNTRLQVEHPVSEAITGLDFVDLQLQIAAGEALPITQQQLSPQGWAFEARLYAEDPADDFRPAAGRLHHLHFPAATNFIPSPLRIDSGIIAGDIVSPYYDPMLAKIITHGKDRPTALKRLTAALTATRCSGVATNLSFLTALSQHHDVVAGTIDTGLVERISIALTEPPTPPESITAAACIIALGLHQPRKQDDPWQSLIGWRHWQQGSAYADLSYADKPLARHVLIDSTDCYRVESDDGTVALSLTRADDHNFALTTAGHRHIIGILTDSTSVTIFSHSQTFHYTLRAAHNTDHHDDSHSHLITAPMPGLVKQINIASGDSVARGDLLLVLEAMKMDHRLTAPQDKIITALNVAVGDQVAAGEILIQFAAAES